MTNRITKFPDEVADFSLDWTPALAEGDSLVANSIAAIAAGSTTLAAEILEKAAVTRVRVSGGTPGMGGRIELSATTTAGEVLGENVSVFVIRR